jgi:2-keto-4-pentenoate hydratase/2-oxohepta-3-ene-1,7-dioic acid hydratase in catechol pathway
MRIARVGPPGRERPVVSVDEDGWLDLSPMTADIDAAFLARGTSQIVAAIQSLLDRQRLPAVETPVSFGPPIVRPGKIVCIGLNYRDHAAETGATLPEEPIVFLKSGQTVVGPDASVLVPRGSRKTDWEVELAVVIGRTARYLDSPDAAADCIAGYTISNDVSEREFQLERGGQWDKGKNCETFNPLGPWLRTADEVDDPQRLRLRLWVNGVLRQDGCTADMVFGVRHLVWYLSQFMVLHPGDVINTGTPAGVALGLPGTPYLRADDVIDAEIEGLGRQRQLIGQA